MTRRIAADCLMEILEEKAFSHIVLKEKLREAADLTDRDRGLITRLTEGTIEYCISIDYVLSRYSRTPVSKLKPYIRTVLRMSVYQLLFLDRIPDSAAVNEAVKLVRKRGLQGLSGFVNGVLRSIAREREAILALLHDEKTPAYIRVSMPEWLYAYFEQHYGEAAFRMAEWFLTGEKDNYVRTKDGRAEKMSGNIAGLEAFLNGELTVQDYVSQQVGNLSDIREGQYIVDVCSAPGGKACHAAALLKGTGCVDARDLTAEKVNMIRENAVRLKLDNLKCKVWDARERDDTLIDQDGQGTADIVLADLPCSGLGIMGKKPDIRFSASMETILSLRELQREILQTVTAYVKPGGKLVYSTCTLTQEENEDNRDYIREQFGLRLIKEQKFLPGEPSDGFYIAIFEK